MLSVDNKIEALGFRKVYENERSCHYERYDVVHDFYQTVYIQRRIVWNEFRIQSYDENLMDKKKWFKLGFEHQKQNGFNPNSYHDIDTSYHLKYPYKCSFKERLPWNAYWTYSGYLDGYNAADPFDCYETIYNIDIRKIWNARLKHKKITKAEYYIYRPHEEVSDELAELLDKSTALMVEYTTRMSRGGRSCHE